MSTVTITLPEHPPANDPRDDAPDCAPRHELAMGFEPDDPHYGADADGRRGVHVAGGVYVDDTLPDRCPVCGFAFDAEDQTEMLARADRQAARERADAAESRAIDAYERRMAAR